MDSLWSARVEGVTSIIVSRNKVFSCVITCYIISNYHIGERELKLKWELNSKQWRSRMTTVTKDLNIKRQRRKQRKGIKRTVWLNGELVTYSARCHCIIRSKFKSWLWVLGASFESLFFMYISSCKLITL